ncbi:hypothetical protein JS532_02960 [Bifidobacterium callimiconis]|uniref:hypothetical protein n=1 Tax=Bifidobacterium callimiconis TaxID=2306973 RepID=UPI001BDD0484|nr:hypothetical protein [Bifidobacterium callimiconis]MBT1176525.1 hypothetical protein [Bifidobacterium callimiconis]
MNALERRLLPIVRAWHGVIPVWCARDHDIDPRLLWRWAHGNDDVQHPARGVYIWFNDDPDTDYRYTHLALSLAMAGRGAVFWGPTVVQMAKLGGWGSPIIHIAVPTRRRRRHGFHWHRDTGFARDVLCGLPVENLRQAVIDGLPYMDWDKQELVLADAVDHGLLDSDEATALVGV